MKAACAGELAAVTFVIAPAVHNLFVPGGRDRLARRVPPALNGTVVAGCLGPVCAEGALDEGVFPLLVPSRPPLVPMIQALTDRLDNPRSA